jgi:hypothetical protein
MTKPKVAKWAIVRRSTVVDDTVTTFSTMAPIWGDVDAAETDD